MRLLSPWDRRSSLSLLTSSLSSRTRRAFGSSFITALHFICLALSAYLQQDTVYEFRWYKKENVPQFCAWKKRENSVPESAECFFIIDICWAQSSNHGRARVSTFKHKHSIKHQCLKTCSHQRQGYITEYTPSCYHSS